jgi:hypothetical protein
MMKQAKSGISGNKDEEVRIYDDDGYWLRAATVCVKASEMGAKNGNCHRFLGPT